MSTPKTRTRKTKVATQQRTVKLRSAERGILIQLHATVLDLDLSTDGVPSEANAGRAQVSDGDTVTVAREVPHSNRLIVRLADETLALIDVRDLEPV